MLIVCAVLVVRTCRLVPLSARSVAASVHSPTNSLKFYFPFFRCNGFRRYRPDWDRKESKKIQWTEPEWEFPEGFVPCHILTRQKADHGDYVYKVLLDFEGSFTEFDPSISRKYRYIDFKVPRRAIRFVDRPYGSDQHLKAAFRHTIGFPDGLVPEQWKTGF
jgi:hypothetical protein